MCVRISPNHILIRRSSVVIIGNPIGVLALNGGVGDVGQMGQANTQVPRSKLFHTVSFKANTS